MRFFVIPCSLLAFVAFLQPALAEETAPPAADEVVIDALPEGAVRATPEQILGDWRINVPWGLKKVESTFKPETSEEDKATLLALMKAEMVSTGIMIKPESMEFIRPSKDPDISTYTWDENGFAAVDTEGGVQKTLFFTIDGTQLYMALAEKPTVPVAALIKKEQPKASEAPDDGSAKGEAATPEATEGEATP